MSALEESRKLLSHARSLATRESSKLAELVKLTQVNPVELKDAMDLLETRLHKVDELQSAVEMEIDEEDLDEVLDEAFAYLNKTREPLLDAAKRLKSASVSRRRRNVSVCCELLKFSGDILQWQSFWDRFESTVDKSDIPATVKLCYLQSLLEGQAKSAIQGFAHTAQNYKTICNLLKERFGNRDFIIQTHVLGLIRDTFRSKDSVASQWNFYNKISSHVNGLEALGISGKEYGVIMVPIILTRLPSEFVNEWFRNAENRGSDPQRLLTFLRKKIEVNQRDEANKI